MGRAAAVTAEGVHLAERADVRRTRGVETQALCPLLQQHVVRTASFNGGLLGLEHTFSLHLHGAAQFDGREVSHAGSSASTDSRPGRDTRPAASMAPSPPPGSTGAPRASSYAVPRSPSGASSQHQAVVPFLSEPGPWNPLQRRGALLHCAPPLPCTWIPLTRLHGDDGRSLAAGHVTCWRCSGRVRVPNSTLKVYR